MQAASLRLFAIGLAFMLAACGQMRWHKEGSDDMALGNDLTNCRAAAQSATQRMYGAQQLPTTNIGPSGAATYEPSPADRQMREQEAVNRCMRDKGYTLVPVER